METISILFSFVVYEVLGVGGTGTRRPTLISVVSNSAKLWTNDVRHSNSVFSILIVLQVEVLEKDILKISGMDI